MHDCGGRRVLKFDGHSHVAGFPLLIMGRRFLNCFSSSVLSRVLEVKFFYSGTRGTMNSVIRFLFYFWLAWLSGSEQYLLYQNLKQIYSDKLCSIIKSILPYSRSVLSVCTGDLIKD